MEKYRIIYQIVGKLTENDALRTFFIVYLMNEGEQREAIENQFWKDVDTLPFLEKNALTDEFRQSFFKLPHLVKDIRSETQELKRSMLSKAA